VTTPPTPAISYNGLLDLTLLDPGWTEEHMLDACAKARSLSLNCIVVRPCDVEAAVRTGLRIGSVSGWPNGDQTTGTKLYETRDLLRRGAREIDFVINASRLLSRQFQYIEMELLQAVEACHKEGAIVKIVFPSSLLNYEAKLVGARICSRVGADFAVVSEESSIAALRPHLADDIGIKFSSVSTRDQLEKLHAAGCTRFGCLDPETLLAPPPVTTA
jgi:deoxyribose-phosphate aldolase